MAVYIHVVPISTCTCTIYSSPSLSTHLPIPGYATDVLQRVDLVARAHGIAGVVQVPDEDLTLTSSRRQQVGLERVKVQRADRPCVLAVLVHLGSLRTAGRGGEEETRLI